jgi:MFS family permease
MFGFGAGLTFIAYSVFELPSNLALERFGARKWLARIMITWGLIGCSMSLVTTPAAFYAARFLLGAAEAGLFPGVILYLTYCFPRRHRARYIAMFALGIPMSNVLGSPVSGLLLEMEGVLGLRGWQWLFVLEAVPAVLLGIAVLIFLADRPAEASWLSSEQRDWLRGELEKERRAHQTVARVKPWLMLADRRVLLLASVFFLTGVPSYGIGLWMPQIVSGLGFSNIATGFLTAVPFVFGGIAMVLWGNRSDARQERVWHAAASASVAFIGLAIGATASMLSLQLVGVCIAASGIYGIKGPFLSLVSETFESSNAAAGIALVATLGNLSGFAAPYIVGIILERTESYQLGLTALGTSALFGSVLLIVSARQSWLVRGRRPDVPQPVEPV